MKDIKKRAHGNLSDTFETHGGISQSEKIEKDLHESQNVSVKFPCVLFYASDLETSSFFQ